MLIADRFLPGACTSALSAYCLLPSAHCAQRGRRQNGCDVNAGVVPECRNICLITYSDLLWQLALQPDTPLANPTSKELNRALRLIIDQRLILQEAEKLPSIEPTAEEIKNARDELVKISFAHGISTAIATSGVNGGEAG